MNFRCKLYPPLPLPGGELSLSKESVIPLLGAGLLSSLKYWLHTVRPERVEGPLCGWFDRLTTNGNRELNSPAPLMGGNRGG